MELLQSSGSILRLPSLEERKRSATNEPPSNLDLTSTPGLLRVAALAKQAAAMPQAPVLILGERGTGVPELARLVHDSDATAHRGRFEIIPAHLTAATEAMGWNATGTLVIEDLEQLRPKGQVWLADRLAKRGTPGTGVRVIATSRLSYSDLLARDSLNQELVFTLDVFRLVVPPLRESGDEIMPLALSFLDIYCRRTGRALTAFAPEAERKLRAHHYPGNRLELRNIIERAVALEGTDRVQESSIVLHDVSGDRLESRPRTGGPKPLEFGPANLPGPTLTEVERAYLIGLIKECRGRRTAVARAMGVSYPTVIRKIAQHGLDVPALLAEKP